MVDSIYQWPSFGIDCDLDNLVPIIADLNKSSPEQDWLDCLECLDDYSFYLCYTHDNFENSMFPNKCWTFQHHCAQHSAPESVVEKMIEMRFPLSLRDGNSKLPIHHINNDMPSTYRALYKPKFSCTDLKLDKLSKMEKFIHNLMQERAGSLLKDEKMPLPILSTYFEHLAYNDALHDMMLVNVSGLIDSFILYPEYNKDVSDVEAIFLSIGNIKYKITENNYIIVESVFS
jgi:hypothetical protein